MGFMDAFLSVMKMNEDNEDEMYDDDYLDEEDEKEEKPAKLTQVKNEAPVEDKRPINKVTQIRQQRKVMGTGMEVCVIKPTTVEEAREITETLLANRTVVLNMEGLDVDIAQRIIDFTSGSCYAINGNLQKISHYIFIITPASVDISGDFQEILNGSFDVPSFNN